MGDEQPTWSLKGGVPVLRCTHCSRCGRTMFPAQAYGCTSCGAFRDALEISELPAEGTLLAFAVVHRHDRHPVPFTLGEIEIGADGPIVRALLADGHEPAIGDRVRARVVEDEGQQRLEFVAATEVTA